MKQNGKGYDGCYGDEDVVYKRRWHKEGSARQLWIIAKIRDASEQFMAPVWEKITKNSRVKDMGT